MKYYKLDRDTKAYLKRMSVDGIKTPADIYSVNDFVVGLKDLSIFSNILEMWFFRATQNSGSGVNVYSFKNNRNNGIIQNGGIWTDNGIFLRGSSSQKIRLFTYENFPNGPNEFGIQVCGIVQPVSWGTSSGICILGSDSFYINTRFHISTGISGGSTSNIQMFGVNYVPATDVYNRHYSNSQAIIGRYNYLAYIPFGLETNQFVLNSSAIAQGGSTTALNFGQATGKNLSLYCGPDTTNLESVHSFLIIFHSYVSSQNMVNIYNLAKTTIAKGLNIP
jgi:hypothetical protein